MGRRIGFQIALGLLIVALVAGVGVYTYNLGMARGMAVTAVASAPNDAVPMVPMWPHPWGFGYGFFPFFPFFPLLFVLLLFVLMRGLLWRGGGCRGWREYDHRRYL
jgi:hypothetical protein